MGGIGRDPRGSRTWVDHGTTHAGRELSIAPPWTATRVTGSRTRLPADGDGWDRARPTWVADVCWLLRDQRLHRGLAGVVRVTGDGDADRARAEQEHADRDLLLAALEPDVD